jgi:two-component system response regulator NreC
MGIIHIGIYDEHRIVGEAIGALLSNNTNIVISVISNDKEHLFDTLKHETINVLLINIHTLTNDSLNLIHKANISFPKTKLLILTALKNEDVILKTIKAGAKGILTGESDKADLLEAIHTLRNGHDYYSKPITHLLLNRYIDKIKYGGPTQAPDINSLSTREIEILKLWGNSKTNKEIADNLFISLRTVESHKNHIMQKLNLSTSVDLVKFAIRNNIIEI